MTLPHTPDHWPLALSLWVGFLEQPAQLKARNAALLKVWEAEDARRLRDPPASRESHQPSPLVYREV